MVKKGFCKALKWKVQDNKKIEYFRKLNKNPNTLTMGEKNDNKTKMYAAASGSAELNI